MPTSRTILHVDMDAFFAAVEQRDHPDLHGKPVLVGGAGPRGVVATASYEARAYGCHSAQPMSIARRRCPQAIVVKPRGRAYREASACVFAIFERFTPLVQPLSIDEAFLDVTGSLRLHGEAADIATQIKALILDETRLTASVGVAPNKFLAKIASDLDKPDGLVIVRENEVEPFLDELPVGKLPGVGPATEKRFQFLGAHTIGVVRGLDLQTLQRHFGSSAQRYCELARGIDERPVVPDSEAKSIGHEQTFGLDIDVPDEVKRVMLDQTEQVARRLRKHQRRARTVTVKIRYGDFETITRAMTLKDPTCHTDELWRVARGLFDAWMINEGFRPVRLIGVTASHFDHAPQMGLLADPDDAKAAAVEKATDAIVARFGQGAIRRAGSMRKDE